MVLKGTENTPRYPWIEGCDKMGILNYGSVTLRDGSRAYKADPNRTETLKELGYIIVGSGTSYIYVKKGT